MDMDDLKLLPHAKLGKLRGVGCPCMQAHVRNGFYEAGWGMGWYH